MLRFSANISLLFAEFPLIERFQLARQYGFSAVEIQFPYSLTPQQIKQQLETHQLQLALFNIDADDLLEGGEGLAAVPEKTEQFDAALQQAAQYARILKPHAINVLPGRCFNSDLLPKYQETLLNNLVKAAQTFAQLDILTTFEAINTLDMPDFIIHNGAQMLKVLEALKQPNLFIQYDIYHMRRMQENYQQFLTEHIDKIAHIQFADCPGRGFPGSGEIDFKALFKLIDESAYQGWLGAEYNSPSQAESFQWLVQQSFP